MPQTAKPNISQFPGIIILDMKGMSKTWFPKQAQFSV